MRLEDLNDEELRVFLEGQSVQFLRDLFTNVNSLRDKLKGFRPNKADKTILVNTCFNLIKREKNQKLIQILTNRYKDYVKEINETIEKMENDGYPHDAAFAIMVEASFNPSFRKVFYKLEDISEDVQKRTDELIELIAIIDIRASKQIDKKTNPELEGRIELLEKENSDVSKTIKELDKTNVKQDKAVSDLDIKIDQIKRELILSIDTKATVEQLNQRIDGVLNKLKTELKDLSKSEEIVSLKEEIKELREKLNSLPQVKRAEIYKFEHIKAPNFDSMEDCEYLADDIGDVIEHLVDSDSLDVFREYIVETLYGNKPIVTTSKLSDLVADIYASVLTGGEYFSIDIGEDYSLNKLEDTIDSIVGEKTNVIVLIKGLLNIHNHRTLMNYLSSHSFTHKFIFDIHYEKETRFMPLESLDDFYFLLGDLKNGQIEYRYTHVFSERKTITNNGYEKTLSQIGVSLKSTELYNVKFYGLLAYSLIPFIANHNDMDKSEVINQILDFSIRKKCEAILND